MRYILLLFCLILSAFSDVVEVSANSFISNALTTELNGSVVVKKGQDTLQADKAIIQTDKNKKPTTYTAIGNVSFYAKLPDREIKGKANKAIYDAINDEYQLISNAKLEEIGKNNTITGDLIIFNMKTQEVSVSGSAKKPSVITFSIDESK